VSVAAARRVLLLGVSLLVSCSKPAGDPVAQALQDMAGAAADRDADALVARLAPGFAGQGGIGAAETAAELRRTFALYESIEVGLADVVIERPQAGTALARFRASVAGKPKSIGGLAGMLPDAERLRFEVALAEADGTWRVTSATWERLAPAS
jgi:hypothetical protein